MRGLTPDAVTRVRVRARGRVDDVVCVAVGRGAPLGWLRSADVLVLPDGSHETVERLFDRFPGCSVVVTTARPPGVPACRAPSSRGPRNLIHVRGGPVPRAAVVGDPRSLGALAHARRSLARGAAEGTEPVGPDPTVVVGAGGPTD